MSRIPDGDKPAYPKNIEAYNEKVSGMTMRDHFAIEALTTIMMTDGDHSPLFNAIRAYKCADAMLVAREEDYDE